MPSNDGEQLYGIENHMVALILLHVMQRKQANETDYQRINDSISDYNGFILFRKSSQSNF